MLCTALLPSSTIPKRFAPLMLQISRAGQADQTINKSRFIAVADYCADEREVAQFLRGLAGQHGHAHHLAFAFRLMQGRSIVERSSDAGEPTGTAGMPILQHLHGRDLVNCCVAVVRYYGGINLGTGGLVRAYGGTARLALDAAQTAPYVEMTRLQLDIDYHRLDLLLRDIAKLGGEVLDKQFGEHISILANIPADQAAGLAGRYRR